MIDGITGVVLAGGKSTRMGTNKARLPYQGAMLVEAVLGKMRSIFTRVVLSVNLEDPFPEFEIEKISDRYPETGPLGGIVSCLEQGERRIFCVACDMPFLSAAVIEFQCGFSDCDAVLPVWKGYIESLHAYYADSLLPFFRDALLAGHYKITDALLEAHVRYVGEDELKRFDPKGDSFRNINTPEDYSGLA